MQMPSFIRLFSNDYDAQYQSLLQTLANTINPNGENTFDALSNNLTLKDNMLSIITNVTLSVNSNGIPNNNQAISLNNTIKQLEGIQVLYANNSTNATTYPTGAPFISWTQTVNAVTINHVTGLTPNDTWVLHLCVYGAS